MCANTRKNLGKRHKVSKITQKFAKSEGNKKCICQLPPLRETKGFGESPGLEKLDFKEIQKVFPRDVASSSSLATSPAVVAFVLLVCIYLRLETIVRSTHRTRIDDIEGHKAGRKSRERESELEKERNSARAQD